MTTEIFGQHWTASHAVEAAYSCALPTTARARSLEQLRVLLTHPVSGCGNGGGSGGGSGGSGGGGCYAHVESIAATTEAIYAATTQGSLGQGLGQGLGQVPGDHNTATSVLLLLHVRLHLMRASMDITMRAITPSTKSSPTTAVSGGDVGGGGGGSGGLLSSQGHGQGLAQGMIITKDNCLVELKRLADLLTQPYQA